jgi:hypothetical protein
MARVPSTTELAALLEELLEDKRRASLELSEPSRACRTWVLAAPNTFNAPYDRFERARNAFRYQESSKNWEELKASITELAAALRAYP